MEARKIRRPILFWLTLVVMVLCSGIVVNVGAQNLPQEPVSRIEITPNGILVWGNTQTGVNDFEYQVVLYDSIFMGTIKYMSPLVQAGCWWEVVVEMGNQIGWKVMYQGEFFPTPDGKGMYGPVALLPLDWICQPGSIDKPGTYFLADTIRGKISVDAPYVYLRNLPGYYFPILGNGNEVGVNVNQSHVEIYGIPIFRCGCGISLGSYSQPVFHCVVDSCEISNNLTGINVSYSDHNWIRNCQIHHNGRAGIEASVADSNHIVNCSIYNNTNCGIILNYCEYNEITRVSGDSNWVWGIACDPTNIGNFGILNSVSGDSGNWIASGNDIQFVPTRVLEPNPKLKDPPQVETSAVPTLSNHPNPSNPETTIKYQLPKSGKVVLKIYNTLGQEIRTLVNEEKKAGYYEVRWDGRNNNGVSVSSGVYIYQIRARDFKTSKQMVIVR